MKKVIAFLLLIAFVLSFSISVSATDQTALNDSDDTQEESLYGKTDEKIYRADEEDNLAMTGFDSVTMNVGDTRSFTVYDNSDSSRVFNTGFSWRSSNPTCLKITQSSGNSCTVKAMSYTSEYIVVSCSYTHVSPALSGTIRTPSGKEFYVKINNNGSSSGGSSGYSTQNITVSFNANGGSVYPSSRTIGKGNSVGTLPTPTRSGYSFDGWYTYSSGGSRVYSSTTFNYSTTIYAHWTKIASDIAIYSVAVSGVTKPTAGATPSYYASVSQSANYKVQSYNSGDFRNGVAWYDLQNDSSMSSYDKFVAGKRYSVHVYLEPKTGYSFKSTPGATLNGYSATSSSPLYDGTVCVTYTFTCEVTTITVSFNSNGGTVSPTSKTITSGSSIGTLPTPTRSGYTFNGWYTSSSGGSRVYTSTTFSNNTTVYAHWSPNTYTLTFNPNGGTVSPNSKTFNGGSSVGVLPTPTRSGYAFDGWYTSISGGSRVYASTTLSYSTTVYAHWSPIATPKINNCVSVDEGVRIQWNTVSGAEKYRVYYKNSKGNWVKMGDTAANSFVDTDVKSGATYTYTVRCINSAGTAFTSGYDSTGYKYTYNMSTPSITSMTSSASGVTIKWGSVVNARKYRVYYKGNDGWIKLAEVTGTSYTHSDAVFGKTYTYTVRCIKSDSSRFTSSYNSSGWTHKHYLNTPTISGFESTTKGVKIKWNSVTGAQKYRVYYKNSKGNWVKMGETTGNSFVDDDVRTGKSYTYTVRCIDNSLSAFMSDYDKNGKKYTYTLQLATPNITSCTSVSDGIKISWGAVPGANKYRVYYKGKDGWKKIAETGNTYYLDTDVRSGNSYTYTVRCITDNGKDFASGYDSTGATATYNKAA